MLFDSHCHLQFLRPAKLERVMQNIVAEHMRVVCVGTTQSDWRRVIEFAERNPQNVFCALGLYPTEENKDTTELERLAVLDSVKAIGETGLEYFHETDPAKREEQKTLFKKHITLAARLGKPLTVHARDSYGDTYDVLKAQGAKRFVMHSFLGSPEFLEKFCALGAFISFSSIVCFADDYDAVIREAPTERMLVETDAPFIRNNVPMEVRRVVEKIAKIKHIAYDEIERTTYANAHAFFGLNR